MATCVAEHLDEEVGAAVDDVRLLHEIGRAVDEAVEAQAAADAVEIAERRPRLRQKVEAAKPCCALPVCEGEAGAELADVAALTVPLADLTGDEQHVARTHEGHVVGQRYRRAGQFDFQLLQPCFDLASHRWLRLRLPHYPPVRAVCPAAAVGKKPATLTDGRQSTARGPSPSNAARAQNDRQTMQAHLPPAVGANLSPGGLRLWRRTGWLSLPREPVPA